MHNFKSVQMLTLSFLQSEDLTKAEYKDINILLTFKSSFRTRKTILYISIRLQYKNAFVTEQGK